MGIRKEIKIYAECETCGGTEDISNSPANLIAEDLEKIVTRSDRQVAVRKDGVNISYYDSRVWKKLSNGKLICPMCAEDV